jgi:protein TonB
MRPFISVLILLVVSGCATVSPEIPERATPPNGLHSAESSMQPIEPDSEDAKARGDAQAVTLHVVPAIYPIKMLANKVSGSVLVEYIVECDGTVQIAKAIQQTNEEFGQAAIACVKKWKFKPGLKAGIPVRTRNQIPLVFTP